MTNTFTKPLFFLMLLLFTISCDKDDETSGNNFLSNGDIENGQQDWQTNTAGAPNENGYKFGASSEIACSGKGSLFISCDKITNKEQFANYFQSFPASVFKSGENLTLTVKVKGDNLIGDGVSVAFRGNKNGAAQPTFFKTTQGFNTLNGTFDCKEVKLSLNPYLGDSDIISVFLVILPNTTGKVYFDDIFLTNN
jgi:hypothetical protein